MDANDLPRLTRVRELVRSGAARSIRVGASLTVGEVAEAVEVAPTTIWRWENGERTPRGEAALRYGDVLGALMTRGRAA